MPRTRGVAPARRVGVGGSLLVAAWILAPAVGWAVAAETLDLRVGLAFVDLPPSSQVSFQEVLEQYGAEVLLLEQGPDPREALEIHPSLDFVVRVVRQEQRTTASIYGRDGTLHRREIGADRSQGELESLVLRYLSERGPAQEAGGPRLAETLPSDAEGLTALGKSLLRDGRPAEAKQRLLEALAADPGDADAHFYLAKCYEKLGPEERAVEHLESALRIDPEHERASVALGNHHLRSGNLNEAIAIYKRWVDSPQNGATARWNLALAYQKKRDWAAALENLESIDRTDPLFTRAQEKILEIEASSRWDPLAWRWPVVAGALGLFAVVAVVLFVLWRRRGKPDEAEGEARVFVSYRREDSADVTGRICDRLAGRFGREAVFMDVDSIPLGADYRSDIQTAVGRCDALLVIIGDRWLSVTDDAGRRRLDDPGDFVHIEVRWALERGVPVVPILVQGASIPSPEELPEPLRPLAFRNAAEVRPGRDFHPDVDRLIESLLASARARESSDRQTVEQPQVEDREVRGGNPGGQGVA